MGDAGTGSKLGAASPRNAAAPHEREGLLQAAYGPNLAALRAIKAKYDPTNLFPGVLNIKPQTV
jgi:FAD/FMN-containing dehydrogenase